MAENIVRCGSCGAENSVDNRFCGMCGRSLLAIPAPPKAPTPVEQASVEYPTPLRITPAEPAAAEPSAPIQPSTPAPAYTGGLFRIGDERQHDSRHLDYLLEDDEPESHRGLFIVLGLIALLLAAGLGYLRFRNGGLPGFLAGSKPSTQTAASDSGAGSPALDSAPKEASGSANEAAPPAPTAATTPSSPAPASPSPDTTAPASPDSSQLGEVRPKNPSETAAEVSPAPPAAKPTVETPAPAPPKPTPVEKPKPAPKPEDPVTMGEKYIYGRGVPQDCARGLRAVKPAADQANAKAMITMGALYATGHCVSRDLPTAYRFFALALRKDPENAALKQNVEMVWGQMTQLERQQAIRITQ